MRTTDVTKTSAGGTARRAQLVGCAIDALVELGYARTSVAEVARRAGVSKGVVTYHFPSKEDLLGEVVVSLYRDAGEQIARAGAGDSVMSELEAYITSNLAFVAENPRHVRAVMEVASNVRPADGRGEDPLVTHLQELIERGQASGELAGVVDAGVLAVTIRASIDAAAARAAVDPAADPRAHAGHLATLVRRALRTEER